MVELLRFLWPTRSMLFIFARKSERGDTTTTATTATTWGCWLLSVSVLNKIVTSSQLSSPAGDAHSPVMSERNQNRRMPFAHKRSHKV